MKFIQLAIRQPITITVGIIFIMIFGSIALRMVPIEMTPQVDDTIIAVTTTWENASPQEVESEIIEKQEEKLQGLASLHSMSSTSTPSRGSIRLQFNNGVDKDIALREVSDKLREVPSYPTNVNEPVVEASDPETNNYIAWFILTHSDPNYDMRQLQDFADDRIKPQLERVPGISEVNALGGTPREVKIFFDAHKLAQYKVTIAQLAHSLRAANKNFSGGALTRGKSDIRVRAVGRFKTLAAVENTVIRKDESGIVRVSDVATVAEGYKEASDFVREKGRVSLAFNFQREPGTNVIDIMEKLQAEVAQLHEPDGLFETESKRLGLQGSFTMEQAFDATIYIHQAIALVLNNIYIGGALAIMVLLLFLRSIRSVGIIALAIPVSMIGASVLMVFMGRTVNVVSLAGMAFAVGMVVDNSIVVLENIYRHLEITKCNRTAALQGTAEVAGPVLASSLTTLIVFIPILLIPDQVGLLFRDISLALMTAVAFSYTISMTVIPSAAAIFMKPTKHTHREKNDYPLLQRIIYTLNGSTIARLAIVALFASITIFGSYHLAPPLDYLPKGNRNIAFGMMIPPPGYNMEQFSEMGERVEKNMQPYWQDQGDIPPVSEYLPTGEVNQITPSRVSNYFLVGFGGILFHGAIASEDKKAVDNVPLLQHVSNPQTLPGVYSFAFQLPIFNLGGSTGSAIKINLTGVDLDQISSSTMALFGSIMQKFGPGSTRPNPSNFNINTPELQVYPKNNALAENNLTQSDLGLSLQAASDGIILGEYDRGDALVDLKLLSNQSAQNRYITNLPAVPIVTPAGDIVPLENVGTFAWVDAPEHIKRVDRNRAITLEFTAPDGLPLEDAITTLEGMVGQLRAAGAISPTVTIRMEGSAGKLKNIRTALMGDGSLTGTLSSSLFLSCMSIYLLMVVLFQSWGKPLIIMVTVPLAAFGGFVGLALIHHWSEADRYMPIQNLDMLTILGFVILAGVVVNNAILIVSQATLLMKKRPHHKSLDARSAIAQAVQNRLRPIAMSTLTSVGGMLPLVLNPGSGSELYRGLGAVVVGGLLMSTLFTLFLVPVLMSITEGLGARIAKLVGRSAPLIMVLLLVGCSSPTEITGEKEKVVVPAQWNAPAHSASSEEVSQWWRQFDDPVMHQIIQAAQKNNLDLHAGFERLMQARARVGIARAQLIPQLGAGGSYIWQEGAANGPAPSAAIEVGNLNLGTTWEIDLFGRVRNGLDAANLDVVQQQELLRDLHIAITSDTALTYVTYRAIDERIAIAHENIKLQEENLKFVEARRIAGTATALDSTQATTILATSRAALQHLERDRRQSANVLAILTGQNPGAIDALLTEALPLPQAPSTVAIGIPADVMRRRPDIRRSEAAIGAQAARLEIAQKEYLPKFSLTGTIGLSSLESSTLFNGDSQGYSFGPTFSWRIFSAGQIGNEIATQEAILRELVISYRQTVLKAFGEVENSLVAYEKELIRQKHIRAAFASSDHSVKLARNLYTRGLRDYQSVINSLLARQTSQEAMVVSYQLSATALINLYRAMGGGLDGVHERATEEL